jgi:hypothetical protein
VGGKGMIFMSGGDQIPVMMVCDVFIFYQPEYRDPVVFEDYAK